MMTMILRLFVYGMIDDDKDDYFSIFHAFFRRIQKHIYSVYRLIIEMNPPEMTLIDPTIAGILSAHLQKIAHE